MIQSIQTPNLKPVSFKNDENRQPENRQQSSDVSFGDDYYYQRPSHPIKNAFLAITDDLIGLVGLNAALWWIQSFVNGKILVGKINKHFTKNIKDKEQLWNLAHEMKNEKGGLNNLNIVPTNTPGEAFYTHEKNAVVVGKDSFSSLFHEVGHAVEENSTKAFKWLQRRRGNYTALALLLYTLMSQSQKSKNYYDDENTGLISKMKRSLSKSEVLIPLLAFSPELITEAKASQEGLKFLKGKVGKSSPLYKNVRSSYLTCFSTYLFIPVSIMLMDALRNGVHNKRVKSQQEKYQRMYY